MKDGIFVHPILPDNQPGPFIQVNAAACALLGYSPAEFRRMTPWELDDPATSSDYILQAMQQLRDRGTARFEAYQVAKDGRKVLVELHAHVCEIHGAPHIIAVGRDITARKQAENELRESEQRYKPLLESINDSIVVITPDFEIVQTNYALERDIGKGRDIIGERCFAAIIWIRMSRPDGVATGDKSTGESANGSCAVHSKSPVPDLGNQLSSSEFCLSRCGSV